MTVSVLYEKGMMKICVEDGDLSIEMDDGMCYNMINHLSPIQTLEMMTALLIHIGPMHSIEHIVDVVTPFILNMAHAGWPYHNPIVQKVTFANGCVEEVDDYISMILDYSGEELRVLFTAKNSNASNTYYNTATGELTLIY